MVHVPLRLSIASAKGRLEGYLKEVKDEFSVAAENGELGCANELSVRPSNQNGGHWIHERQG